MQSRGVVSEQGWEGNSRSIVKANSDSAERFPMPTWESVLCFSALYEGPGGKVSLWNLHQTPQKGLAPTAAFWGLWPVLDLNSALDPKSSPSFGNDEGVGGGCLHVRIKDNQSDILIKDECKPDMIF